MLKLKRILLIAPSEMTRTPAFDRAHALASATGALLHIVALVTDGKNPKPLSILATIDLSHLEELTQGLNDRILDLAATLAASCGAALHLLNVSHWTVVGDATMSVPS